MTIGIRLSSNISRILVTIAKKTSRCCKTSRRACKNVQHQQKRTATSCDRKKIRFVQGGHIGFRDKFSGREKTGLLRHIFFQGRFTCFRGSREQDVALAFPRTLSSAFSANSASNNSRRWKSTISTATDKGSGFDFDMSCSIRPATCSGLRFGGSGWARKFGSTPLRTDCPKSTPRDLIFH